MPLSAEGCRLSDEIFEADMSGKENRLPRSVKAFRQELDRADRAMRNTAP